MFVLNSCTDKFRMQQKVDLCVVKRNIWITLQVVMYNNCVFL